MDTAKIKQTSAEWERESDYVILDPDGWDRQGDFHFSFCVEKITYDEFIKRLAQSTIMSK